MKLLEKVENKFSNDYETIYVNGQKCFRSLNGTVFYFIVLNAFKSLVIEYANNIQEAKNNIFEDGDQFDISQDFDALILDIRRELSAEVI